jgi:hypothetical protein
MKKCKNCKVGFDPIKFNQKYCLESECVKVWIETTKEKEWKTRKHELKEKLQTVQELTKLAQTYFNSYIRNRDRNKGCISCGTQLGQKFDAGHYYSMGGHKAVTFNEDNVHGQCVYCNQYLHGNLLNYQIGIQQRIGAERLIDLQGKAHETRKYTRDELKEIISIYKEKIKFSESETNKR